MPYWQIVTRSFRIAWDHKYLWLLAFFSGEASFSFNYSQGSTGSTNRPPDAGAVRENVTAWIGGHIGVLHRGCRLRRRNGPRLGGARR